MAELDYAFLADYAAVQDGKLTAVGASFTLMRTPVIPGETILSIAGRVRVTTDEKDLEVTIRVRAPENAYVLEFNIRDDDLQTYPRYADKRGILFAVQVRVPLISVGLYEVEIDLAETASVDRVLKFEVTQPSNEQ